MVLVVSNNVPWQAFEQDVWLEYPTCPSWCSSPSGLPRTSTHSFLPIPGDETTVNYRTPTKESLARFSSFDHQQNWLLIRIHAIRCNRLHDLLEWPSIRRKHESFRFRDTDPSR